MDDGAVLVVLGLIFGPGIVYLTVFHFDFIRLTLGGRRLVYALRHPREILEARRIDRQRELTRLQERKLKQEELEKKRYYEERHQERVKARDAWDRDFRGVDREPTVEDIFQTLTEQQKNIVYYMIGEALNNQEKEHLLARSSTLMTPNEQRLIWGMKKHG